MEEHVNKDYELILCINKVFTYLLHVREVPIVGENLQVMGSVNCRSNPGYRRSPILLWWIPLVMSEMSTHMCMGETPIVGGW